MIIQNLFPIPVAILNIERNITDEELTFANDEEVRLNFGNSTSVNNYILKCDAFKDIKTFIDKSIKQYFNEVYVPLGDIEVYVTQSWINYTKQGQYHHKHDHPNSLFSGVFYLDVTKNLDQIKFFKDKYQTVKIPSVKWNAYNPDSWWVPVETGDLILFPSSTSHMVEDVVADKTRISIAFNTFVRGDLGDGVELTSLSL
jgi:uncharacterized protein (TIGR02466 family)